LAQAINTFKSLFVSHIKKIRHLIPVVQRGRSIRTPIF